MKLCRFSLGIPLLVCSVLLSGLVAGNNVIEEIDSNALHTIEGRVYQPEFLSTDFNWQHDTSISINGGEFKGFLREDGTFVVSGIPSGSYLVEIENPDYIYESVRVEINPKGKFRARKVNLVQPAQVIQVPYPLKLKAANRFKYFQTREQWKITDFLFSPMVLMMLLPLLLLLVLPKMMSDPETKREIEENFRAANDMPEIGEMITSFFTGGSSNANKDKDKESKQKQIKQKKKN